MSQGDGEAKFSENKGKMATSSSGGMFSSSVHVKPPQQFHITEGQSASKEWNLWKQMWENYVIVTNLTSQNNEYQKAVFMCTIGHSAMEVYNSFQFNADEDPNDISTIIKKFDEHFTGEINETYVRFQFNKRMQQPGESFEHYLTQLRNLAKTCNFCKCLYDSLLRDQIVLGICDDNARKRLLQERKLDLTRCIDICRSTESANVQLGAINENFASVCKVDETRGRITNPRPQRRPRAPQQGKQCKFCLTIHAFRKELCPAWGRRCSVCGEKNHWRGSSVCKKKDRVNMVEVEESDTDSDFERLCTIQHTVSGVARDASKNAIMCEMYVESKKVQMQIDCGATVNVIPLNHVGNATINPTKVTLRMWNNDVKEALGTTKLVVTNPSTQHKYLLKFVVVDDKLTPLLSRKAAERMSLITVNYDQFKKVNAVQATYPDKIMSQFPTLFDDDIGTLPGIVQLTLREEAQPVVCPPKRIPVEMKDRVQAELERLVSIGVIEPVDQPTDWVNQMTIATKQSGELRICLDPRSLNKALKREHYQLPVLEDILHDLAEAKLFSKLDLKHGYWHCVLDEPSSLLTTFATPFGRFKWLRLPFGLNVSSEIFQKRLVQALEGLPCTAPIADDILLYGKAPNKNQAESHHDENLTQLLNRCKEKGIKLNKGKAVLKTKEIEFMGHLVTADGLKADPSKIEAILKMDTPTDKQAIERLNGTVNYLAKFLPKLSEVMTPLRQLTHKDTEWHWDAVHDKAFNEVKELVTKAPVLAYYDQTKDLSIQCDASSKGLGAVLLQEQRPIAYASRALTDAETRYATIEKEMLAVVFALEKWHQFTYGRPVTVYTDHKPLVSITQKPLDKAPRRLQGMLVRSLNYNVVVEYLPGNQQHIADMMSRSCLPIDEHDNQREFETVHAVKFVPMSGQKIQEIQVETGKDETLKLLRTTIQQGFPEHKSKLPPQLAPYFNIRDELSVYNGLVFRGERLVIPISMRGSIKKVLHTAHTGIEGCLRRARECVYWPGISAEIKEWISTCETCREYENASQAKQPLMVHEVTDRPWEKVGVDVLTYKNTDYLITVDYYSNYWEIDRLENTKASTIIRKLKAHFARFGIPSTLVTDNCPNLVGDAVQRFTKQWDIQHTPSSPHHSQSNGKVEAAVKAAKRMLRKTEKTQEDQYLALLAIRNTPSQGIGRSPAQRLMNRRTRTTLPTTEVLLQPRVVEKEAEQSKLRNLQQRQAFYYNRNVKDLPPLQEGQTVRMKPFTLGDKTWKKATVQRKLDDRSYLVENQEGTVLRRNRVHLKSSEESPNRGTDTEAEQTPTEERSNTENHVTQHKPAQEVKRQDNNTQVTRSGRVVRRPAYLNDYQMNT